MASVERDRLLMFGQIFATISQGLMAFMAATIASAGLWSAIYGFSTLQESASARGFKIQYLPAIPLFVQLLLALAFTIALFAFFGKLKAIIFSVEKGDPFEAANADRVSAMAWLLLAANVIYWLPAVATMHVVRVYLDQNNPYVTNVTFGAFDLICILMVLVLFILARVFRHGAAMREDLEGTV
jgi:hypothetical protein